jgi:hypothetical protein
MTKQLIETTDHFDLFYHDDHKIVHHIFKEAIDSDSFHLVLDRGTEVLAEHKATKWLADNRRQETVLSDDDNQWATTEWFPRTMEAGWKYWAIVVPDSFANRVDLMRYIEPYHATGINVKVFTDDNEALEWLQRVDK